MTKLEEYAQRRGYEGSHDAPGLWSDILTLHMLNTGFSEGEIGEYYSLKADIRWRLDNWGESRNQFDAKVRELIEIVLAEPFWLERTK